MGRFWKVQKRDPPSASKNRGVCKFQYPPYFGGFSICIFDSKLYRKIEFYRGGKTPLFQNSRGSNFDPLFYRSLPWFREAKSTIFIKSSNLGGTLYPPLSSSLLLKNQIPPLTLGIFGGLTPENFLGALLEFLKERRFLSQKHAGLTVKARGWDPSECNSPEN